MQTPLIEVKGVSKHFPGVKALDEVDFNLYPGEVHILVGENGAGKSTLAKIILGAYQPDSGTILCQGEPVRFSTPRDALKLGIAAVYQELTMVPYLNAAQNIFLNREPHYPGTPFVNQEKMQRDAKSLLAQLNSANINTRVPVKLLGVAEQQMIEIAKCLSFNPRVIVFDEPTATLSEREVESLFRQIHQLKGKGIGIIYVSHRMKEFAEIGDRITVLRDGRFIRTLPVGSISDEDLVNLMVGRDVNQVFHRTPNAFCEEALVVEGVSDRKGRVRDVSLTVRKGEIVGLAGLVGSGRTELARLIFGIDRPKSGRVLIGGKDVTAMGPPEIVRHGLGMLPEDRKRTGLALKASISWNTTAVSLGKLFPSGFVSEKKGDLHAMKFVRELKTATPDVRRPVRLLSGGNQQKVVISKWLSAESEIMIFDEPTRGIDVGAKMEIYALLDRLASEGKAILMISSEMQEVLGMSDRIYIMNDGRIAGEMLRCNFNADQIGSCMLGIGGKAT